MIRYGDDPNYDPDPISGLRFDRTYLLETVTEGVSRTKDQCIFYLDHSDYDPDPDNGQ